MLTNESRPWTILDCKSKATATIEFHRLLKEIPLFVTEESVTERVNANHFPSTLNHRIQAFLLTSLTSDRALTGKISLPRE